MGQTRLHTRRACAPRAGHRAGHWAGKGILGGWALALSLAAIPLAFAAAPSSSAAPGMSAAPAPGTATNAARKTTLATPAAAAAAAAAIPKGATRYTLDQAKSSLEFAFTQAGALNKGRFKTFSVSFDYAPNAPSAQRLDVAVDVNSLDSSDQERDKTLRGADLFDVAKFPQAHFTSTQITRTATGLLATGTLTLRGVTRPLAVPFAFHAVNEQGASIGYLTGKLTLHRLDFGVGQGEWKSTEWVGNNVVVSFSLRMRAAR